MSVGRAEGVRVTDVAIEDHGMCQSGFHQRK